MAPGYLIIATREFSYFLPMDAFMFPKSEYVIKLIPLLVTFRSKEGQTLTRFTYAPMGKADLNLLFVEIRHFLQNSTREVSIKQIFCRRMSVESTVKNAYMIWHLPPKTPIKIKFNIFIFRSEGN